ncbi:MAG: NHL repeat-containing protein [Candidatus Edwardsbacteria bacterium]
MLKWFFLSNILLIASCVLVKVSPELKSKAPTDNILTAGTAVLSNKKIALQFLSSFGAPGNGPGELNHSTAITYDFKGRILIADAGNHRIVIFDSLGHYLSEFGGFGSQDGQFQELTDLVAKNDFFIYTVDSQNRCLQRFEADGKFLLKIENVEFKRPFAVTFAPSGEMYVLDQERCKVFVFDEFGRRKFDFGEFGTGEGQMINPQKIVFFKEKIFVTDQGNGRVAVFSRLGRYLTNLGKNILHSPVGLKIAPNGNLLVTDTGTSSIVVLNSFGQLMSSFSTELKEPIDLVLVGENKLYVLDRIGGYVAGFRIE